MCTVYTRMCIHIHHIYMHTKQCHIGWLSAINYEMIKASLSYCVQVTLRGLLMTFLSDFISSPRAPLEACDHAGKEDGSVWNMLFKEHQSHP